MNILCWVGLHDWRDLYNPKIGNKATDYYCKRKECYTFKRVINNVR